MNNLIYKFGQLIVYSKPILYNRLSLIFSHRHMSSSIIFSDPPISSPKVPVIGTHSGSFHADEAMACWLLRQLPENSKSYIVRTRNPTKLALCDFVVDVGGVYAPEKNRFDHHQRYLQLEERLNSEAFRKYVEYLNI